MADATLYVASYAGIQARDTSDGSLRWRRGIAPLRGPVVANGVVYTGGRRIRAFDAQTGDVLWRTPRDRARYRLGGHTGPIVVGGALYAGFHDRLRAWLLPGG